MLKRVPAGLSVAALVAWVPTVVALVAHTPDEQDVGAALPVARTPDQQEIVAVTAAQRRALVETMNGNLRGYAAVLTAAGQGAPVTAAAQALDANRGTDRDPSLRAVLPAGWLRLGGEVHRGFGELAADGPTLGPREVAARLAGITTTCIECHATYAWPG